MPGSSDPIHSKFIDSVYEQHELLSKNKDRDSIQLKIITNFELERELLGFGAKMKVLRPRVLVMQKGTVKNDGKI